MIAILAFGCVAVVLPGVPAIAASLVSVGSMSVSNKSNETVYRLRIGSAAGTTVVILPDDTLVSTLMVNGIVRERVGLAVAIGAAPLGHAGATVTLADERPTDRVEIRVKGSTAQLRFVNDDVLKLTHGIGLTSGAYYAVLISLAIVQLITLCTLRDTTIAWYFGFTLSMLGLELARDDLLPRGTTETAHELFRASFLLCLLGFSASFLRLRTQSPRLFVAAIILVVTPLALAPIVILATHRPAPLIMLVSLDLFGMVSLIAVAAIRRHKGYIPATYLGFGLLGLVTTLALRLVFTVAGWQSLVLDNWGLEIGATFDVVAFSFALVLQSRYLVREHARVRRDLDAATFAATHDALTGLANRRGLEAALDRISSTASTVLYVDLDGFKAINDNGGHAQGDIALQDVASIMLRTVRAVDIVARVGGDEFVIVLIGMVEARRIADVTDRITAGVSAMQPLGPGTSLGVSIGSALLASRASFADAVARADADAYRVKIEHREYARLTST